MKKRILFVCGSQNQTTQMHAIAKHLEPDFACVFSPFFGSGTLDWLARRGMLDFTILGGHWRTAAFAYFAAHRLPTDDHARRGPYDLVVTCQDIVFPETLRGQRIVLVQEGMTDPEGPMFDLVKRFRFLPPWLASTAGTGLSDAYETFCVASHGYRELFEKKGVRPHKLVVTGIPNFDDLARWGSRRTMTFDGYALVVTSDGRETGKLDDRMAFLRRAARIAGRRRMVVKLHPNERRDRATREILAVRPDAVVIAHGRAEELVGQCAVLVCEYSSTAYVGLALDKEVHSHFPAAELRRLMPDQHGQAAARIAAVCRAKLDPTLGRSWATEVRA